MVNKTTRKTGRAARKAPAAPKRRKPAGRRVPMDDLQQVRIRVHEGTGEALRAALATPEGEARLTALIQQALKDGAPARRMFEESCRVDFSNIGAYCGREAIPAAPSASERHHSVLIEELEVLRKELAAAHDQLKVARAEVGMLSAQLVQARLDLSRAQGYIDRVNEGLPESLPLPSPRGPKVSVT